MGEIEAKRNEPELEAGPTMAAIILSLIALGLFFVCLRLLESLLLKPERVRSKLCKQGIGGPSPSFFFGNVSEIKNICALRSQAKNNGEDEEEEEKGDSIAHAWTSDLFAHLKYWRNRYGPNFMFSSGTIQILCLTEVETVKEVILSKSSSMGRPAHLTNEFGPLLGRGVLASSGPIWVHNRKTVTPPFYPNKVKDMTGLMVESVNSMLESWEAKVENDGGRAEINVDAYFRALSADILLKACFGSNYSEGKEIFKKVRAIQVILSKKTIGIPGLRYLPTKDNRELWKLKKEIKSIVLKVVDERIERSSHDQDLLQIILEGAKNLGEFNDSSNISRDDFIIDNCKNIYFAGHDTTATTTSWCLMLLALYPDWQARVRSEVLQCIQDGPLNADTVKNMKTLTMVIQETLRLYPAAVFISREALEDLELKKIIIPKGTLIRIPIAMLHHDIDLWGPSAHSFDPQRFNDGIRKACKNPMAYIPFGVGPHVCIGQHFAMVELKIILSLIVSRFEFSISPSYKHSPAYKLVLEPENGVILHVRKL